MPACSNRLHHLTFATAANITEAFDRKLPSFRLSHINFAFARYCINHKSLGTVQKLVTPLAHVQDTTDILAHPAISTE